jgi:hypothetical protein
MTEPWVKTYSGGKPNYTEPKEWVGLTDEEMQGFGNDLTSPHKSIRDVFNAIEAKLREKNAQK